MNKEIEKLLFVLNFTKNNNSRHVMWGGHEVVYYMPFEYYIWKTDIRYYYRIGISGSGKSIPLTIENLIKYVINS